MVHRPETREMGATTTGDAQRMADELSTACDTISKMAMGALLVLVVLSFLFG